MKPEIAKLWVDALRGAEFEQGTGNLEADGMLCCLGVLCRIAERQGVPLKIETVDDGTTEFDGCNTVAPLRVMEWSGLSTTTGDYNSGEWLSNDNDGGKTFSQIAEIIEANVEAL